MKVYTLGIHGHVSREVADAIGLIAHRRQADVIVAARTKAEAYTLLFDRGMAPTTVRDREFRLDESTPTANLIDAGVLTDGVVLAHQLTSANTPVVRIEWDGGFTKVGEFVRGEFVRIDAPTPGLPPAGKPKSPEEDLVDDLRAATGRLNEMEAQLAHERVRRNNLCLTAVEAKLVDAAAAAMFVTPGRVYQLATDARRRLADMGDFRPGLWVELQEPGRDPANYSRAQVVQQPADMLAPDDTEPWVWVHTNGNTFPVRRHRVLAWTPPCSVCPPEEQLNIRSGAGLSVHQAANARHR